MFCNIRIDLAMPLAILTIALGQSPSVSS